MKEGNGSTKLAPLRYSRWDPWRELDAFQHRFGTFAWPTAFAERGEWMPSIEVFEKDGFYTVNAELPGLKKEEVTITYEEGALVLEGERKEEIERKEEQYYVCERSYGKFYRRLPLPEGVDGTKAEATFNDGILTVKMPRVQAAKAAKIEVKVK
jgi:HSP20 family protein